MPRYKLLIEYDGTPFVGWQIQPGALSIQGQLTGAFEAFAGEIVAIQGAGRTDAGVHARGQVAHVDLSKAWETDRVRDALNAHLRPHPIAVLAVEHVADSFNARTSAVRRRAPSLGRASDRVNMSDRCPVRGNILRLVASARCRLLRWVLHMPHVRSTGERPAGTATPH